MAFPKKNTRTTSLRNGQTYLWHLNANWESEYHWVVVKEVGTSGQLLFLDHHSVFFLPTALTVRNAIRAAYRYGWQPTESKAPLRMMYDGQAFSPITNGPSFHVVNVRNSSATPTTIS